MASVETIKTELSEFTERRGGDEKGKVDSLGTREKGPRRVLEWRKSLE